MGGNREGLKRKGEAVHECAGHREAALPLLSLVEQQGTTEIKLNRTPDD
jgi:hypothetical protein